MEPEEELVLAQSAHGAIRRKEERQFVVDGDGQVLEGFLASSLSDPEAELADNRLESALVSVERLLQF